MLEWYITWLDGYDEAKAVKLLYPDDLQDVPRVVELIQVVIKLSDLNLTQPPYNLPELAINVDVATEFDAIRMLAKLLYHLLEPFINTTPHYSLVKNAIYIIAKQQQIDADSALYLPNIGDDPIELLFAFLHICGGHNSAITYKQAQLIGGIYARNPDLHHGHHHLNLT
ncbi:hypothetical protein BU15DRAFT_74075 [Melanogaster broomeanus]|nr:hypothetical protein BU15DRAFT_74075 [Melanogaster broomeanus]